MSNEPKKIYFDSRERGVAILSLLAHRNRKTVVSVPRLQPFVDERQYWHVSSAGFVHFLAVTTTNAQGNKSEL